MNKKSIILIVFLILVLGVIFVSIGFFKNKTEKGDKISVVTTLFPQYDFVKEIGGDKVDVTLLLPPGVEAHSYEPKPSDIVKINNSDLFVYTGEFMEPWAHDITLGVDKTVKVVDASASVSLMKEEGDDRVHKHEDEDEEEHLDDHADEREHEDEHEHNHGGVDPHMWLDFDNAKIMAKNITDALVLIDPENVVYYRNNFESYQNKLSELDNEYKNTLSICKSKTIVYGGHYAFGYMAKRYGLDYLSAQGFSPDSEPTAKDMIALTDQINKNGISYIFYEELTSSKIAETLAKETNAKLLLLNGAHNLVKEDYEKNISFVKIMKNNLSNLKTGLNCN